MEYWLEEICGKTDDVATLLVQAKCDANLDKGIGNNVPTERWGRIVKNIIQSSIASLIVSEQKYRL